MFRTIVIPVDLHGVTDHVIAVAAGLARADDATLHVVYVLSEGRDFEAAAFTLIDEDTVAFHEREIQSVVASAVERARALGARAASHVVEGAPAWRMILDEAARLGADLIVMQTHGRRGIARAVEGSVTEEVLRHGTVPLLALREP